MSDPQKPTFLVSAYSNPAVVKVNGKANYLNCNSFREFIETIIANGSRHIFIDFEACTGMDSTFLGILAGTAIELRKLSPAGDLVIGKLGERNYELIYNLGLQNLLTISNEDPQVEGTMSQLKDEKVEDASKVLKAHEDLTKADEQNVAKFQDVISFLRNQVEKEDQQ